MEDNKRAQVFSGNTASRNGKNLVNLRGDNKAETSSETPRVEAVPAVKREPMETKPLRKTSRYNSLNFFDRFLEYGVYLTVFLMPIFILPFSFEVQEFNKYSLLILMSSLMLFVWTLNSIFIKGRVSFCKSPLIQPFGIFLVAILLSALFGVDRLTSWLGYYGTFSDSFIFYASLFVFFLLSLSLIAQRGADCVIGRLVKASVYSSVLASLVSLLYFVGVRFLPSISTVAGFNTVSGYVYAFAIYLLVMLFVTLYDFASARAASSVDKIVNITAIILILLNLLIIGWASIFLVMAFLLAIASIFSGSSARGGLRQQSSTVVLILLVFSLAVSVSGINFSQVSAGRLSLQESTISSALKKTLSIGTEENPFLIVDGLSSKEALTVVRGSLKEKPLLGSGVGTYYYDFSKYRSADFNYGTNWSIRFGKAYNEMLEQVSTLGLIGVLSYLLLLLSALYLFIRNTHRDQCGVFLFCAFCVVVIFQFLFLGTALLKFIFVLLLIIASGKVFSGEDRIVAGALPVNSQRKIVYWNMDGNVSGKIFALLSVVVVLGCSAVLFFNVQSFRAEAKYKALNDNTDVNTVDSAKLEAVTNLNPYKGEYSLGLSRLYIGRLNSLLPSLGDGSVDVEKVKSESGQTIYHTRRATDLSVNNVAFWENYGFVYKRMSDLGMEGADEWALKGFEAALNLDPNNSIYLTEIGKIYLTRYLTTEGDEKRMNLEKSQNALEEASALKNDYPETMAELALVYFYAGDEEKSLDTARYAAGLKKISVATAVQIGKVYYNLGEMSDAERVLMSALNISKDNSDAHYILGAIYKEQGRKEEALEQFGKVLEFNPGSEDVKGKISELEEGTGDNDKSSE
ncbi:MAG: tetratricopeptide repeat protein [Candidatus Paceibacterota bacterium]